MFLQRTGSSLLYTEGSQLYLEQESLSWVGVSGEGVVGGPKGHTGVQNKQTQVSLRESDGRQRHQDLLSALTHVPGAMAVADLRPVASTMLPSV